MSLSTNASKAAYNARWLVCLVFADVKHWPEIKNAEKYAGQRVVMTAYAALLEAVNGRSLQTVQAWA